MAQDPYDAFSTPVGSQPSARQQPAQAQRRQQPRPQIQFSDDRDALIRTAIGEAANQGQTGMQAVASVALNRSRARNMTPSQVVTEAGQFEPWGNAETASSLMAIQPNDPRYIAAAQAVDAAMAGNDPTNGADHFYAPRAQEAMGRPRPAWDNGSGVPIGDHLFFNLGGGQGQQPAPSEYDAISSEYDAISSPVDDLNLHQPENIDVNALVNTQNDFGVPASQYTQATPFVARDEAGMTPDEVRDYRIAAANLRKGDYVQFLNGELRDLAADASVYEDEHRPGRSEGGGLYVTEPNMADRVSAFATGAGEQIPFLDEAATAAVAGLEGRSFSDVRDDYRQLVEQQNQAYRGERIAGGVAGFAGSLAVPVRGAGAFVSAGQGALQQGGRAALLGAGAGAIQGASQVEGGLAERGQAGAVGGLLGAGMAPIAHGGSNLLQAAAPRIGSGFSEAGSRVAGLFGREAPDAVITREATEEASEYVRRLIGERDLTQNPAFLRGKPITTAEAIGPSGISQATALSRRSGRAGEIAEDVLSARADEQSARLIDDVATAAGIDPSVAAGNVADLAQRGRARAQPLYDAAYAQQDVLSPTLEDLLTRPSMQRALRNAQDIILEEGGDPGTLGLIVRPDGTFEPLVRPSMQTWDYIKRGLDDVIEADRDPVTRRLNLDTRGRAADQTRTALRNELTNADQPWGAAYRAALDAGGDAPRLMTAFQDGARLFSSTTREQDFMSRVGRMGEDERTAAVAGIVDDLYTKARNNRLNLRQLRTPASRAKLTALMGREEADSLIARVTDEQDMARAGGRMMPGTNSVTSEVAEAIRDQDRGAGLMGMLSRNIESSGPVGGTVRTGMEAISSPVAGFVRGIQAPAPQATRDEIQRLLMMSPAEIQELIRSLPAPTRQNRVGGLLASPVGQSSGVLASNFQ